MDTRIAVIIDDEFAWRREFNKALTQAGYRAETYDSFQDNVDATLFIVNAQDGDGRVVGTEFVARLRVSHPYAIIIGTSADLSYIQPRATMTVQEQFHAAGTDFELNTAAYNRDEFLAQIRTLLSE